MLFIAGGVTSAETPAPGSGQVGCAAETGADEIDFRGERVAAFFYCSFQLAVSIQAISTAPALPVSEVMFFAG